VQERAGGFRIAVVDGLGHGRAAEAAAKAAIEVFRATPEMDPTEALLVCDQAVRGTRGAAASVLLIDGARALFAGVGNVEGRVLGGQGDHRFSPDRGVLGRGIRVPRAIEFSLVGSWTVLLHTDGVSSRFQLTDVNGQPDLDELANLVLTNWGRRTDDATVVVVRHDAAHELR